MNSFEILLSSLSFPLSFSFTFAIGFFDLNCFSLFLISLITEKRDAPLVIDVNSAVAPMLLTYFHKSCKTVIKLSQEHRYFFNLSGVSLSSESYL